MLYGPSCLALSCSYNDYRSSCLPNLNIQHGLFPTCSLPFQTSRCVCLPVSALGSSFRSWNRVILGSLRQDTSKNYGHVLTHLKEHCICHLQGVLWFKPVANGPPEVPCLYADILLEVLWRWNEFRVDSCQSEIVLLPACLSLARSLMDSFYSYSHMVFWWKIQDLNMGLLALILVLFSLFWD